VIPLYSQKKWGINKKSTNKRRTQKLEETKNENAEQNVTTVDEPKVAKTVQTSHDDFDWSVSKKNLRAYKENEREQMEKEYDGTFVTITDNQIIKGTVVSINNTDVVLNIGFKSDGLVPLSEFRDNTELKVGDEIEVLVVETENSKGILQLSRKNAKMIRAWEHIVDAYKTGEIVTGSITSKTKGGLIVEVFGMETFLPGSQIDVKPITDYDSFVGKTMEFKVVKVNETIRNAVVSHKALIEKDLDNQRQEIMSKLNKGQVLEGTIKNITDFGAFIDLGGVDGLLYITDISWGRINHPNEVLKINQKLNVVVLDFDDNKKRISLGLKQLTPHPWDVLNESIAVGSTVKGKIVNIEDYGAFLEIQPGVEGLIHVSEVSWSSQMINSKEFFKLGDEYEAKVVTLDRADHKMSLSLKQLTKDPWSDIAEKYPVGSRQNGTVRNLNPYGVYIELEDGITGFVHISDLSWLKRFNHPSEFTKVGEKMDVVVLDIDKENRKLSLGHKQIEEDPWDTFETVFPVGSIHQGTVTRKDDKGATVVLPYGLEAYAPIKHLKKENGKLAEADETIDFKVLEFERNNKRILVSHTRVWEEKVEEEKKEVVEKKNTERRETRKTLKDVNQKVEKSTLGDLGVLASLRQKMESGDATEKKEENKDEQAPDTKPAE